MIAGRPSSCCSASRIDDQAPALGLVRLHLNVGSGPHSAPKPWVNIDPGRRHAPDAVASALALPFADESVTAIYAGHVLEHIAWDRVATALAEFRRVMQPGGRLMVVGPDMDRAQSFGPEVIEGVVVGPAGDYPGDHHRWICRERALVDVVADVFGRCQPVGIADVPTCWPVVSRIGWQCAVAAEKS